MAPMIGSGSIDMYATVADLDPSEPLGQLALVLSPPSLYIYTSTGYQVLASVTGEAPPSPASESGLGTVELATEAEVISGTAGVLVATVARLKAELDRRGAGVVATETAQGILELATTAEAMSGTLTGAYAMNPARVRESIQPESWIAPTLLNSWVNFGGTEQVAGYRKTPWGEVQLRGSIKNGTMTSGTVLFNLPTGYRPANTRRFVGLQNNAACRLMVEASGDVVVAGITDNNILSLESVRFDV